MAANAGSFFSSSAWKRRFSRRRTSPARSRLIASSVPTPERVAGDRDVAAEQLGQALTDRPESQPVLDLAVGPAEVAGQDDPRAALEQEVDGRNGGPDPRIVGHLAVGERHVEVDPHEDPLARDVGVADGQLVHGAFRPRRAGGPRRRR